jgi:hypothetical protein
MRRMICIERWRDNIANKLYKKLVASIMTETSTKAITQPATPINYFDPIQHFDITSPVLSNENGKQ